MLRQINALDEAVAAARSYAGENSLIIVAGKQSVGGLTLNGYPFRNDKGIAVTGINSQGVPSLTWATGPGSKLSASLGRGFHSGDLGDSTAGQLRMRLLLLRPNPPPSPPRRPWVWQKTESWSVPDPARKRSAGLRIIRISSKTIAAAL